MVQRYLAALLASCLILTACRTNTEYDVMFYPSEWYANESQSDDALVLCEALENEGYVFDQFSEIEYGVEINYSSQEQVHYSQSNSINPIIVTSINRDYDSLSIFSEEEENRLIHQAQNFCQSYYQISANLGIDLTLSGVFYWDYINGVRGGFALTENCEVSYSHSWGTGSYANRYEENPDAVCPSGQVKY